MKLENLIGLKVNFRNLDGNRIRSNDKGDIDWVEGARGTWEQFILEKVGEDEYAIKTKWNTYMRWVPEGRIHRAKLERGNEVIGPNERYKFIPQEGDEGADDQLYAIKTAGDTYIQVQPGGRVSASSHGIAHDGKFVIELGLIEDGKDDLFNGIDLSTAKIGFKTKNGTYLKGGNNKVTCKGESMGEEEEFKVVKIEMGGKGNAIKNIAKNQFVSVEEGKKIVQLGGDSVGESEALKIIKYDNRRCVIKTPQGTYFTVSGDQCKHKDKCGPKQIFDIEVSYV